MIQILDTFALNLPLCVTYDILVDANYVLNCQEFLYAYRNDEMPKHFFFNSRGVQMTKEIEIIILYPHMVAKVLETVFISPPTPELPFLYLQENAPNC